jgi:hypothetical protein
MSAQVVHHEHDGRGGRVDLVRQATKELGHVDRRASQDARSQSLEPDTRLRLVNSVSAARSSSVRFTTYRLCILAMEHIHARMESETVASMESTY